MEHEQKSNEDSKNRILTEFSAEKDRLLKEIHQKERELEMQREKFHKDKKEITEQMNREFNEKMRMIEKRNQVLKTNTILLPHKRRGKKTLAFILWFWTIFYLWDLKTKNKNNIEIHLVWFIFGKFSMHWNDDTKKKEKKELWLLYRITLSLSRPIRFIFFFSLCYLVWTWINK